MEISNGFPYKALPDASQYIRLLRIDPGEGGDDLTYSLEVFKLDDTPEHAAISYTWGITEPARYVTINGSHVSVRDNCRYAMWQNRLHGLADYYWMDAICINQADLTEKNSHVAMMGAIYQNASVVVCCVGEVDSDLAALSESLEDAPSISYYSDAELWHSWLELLWLQDHSGAMAQWETAQNFARRPYWARQWILQEIFLAKTMLVLCSSLILRQYDFEQIISFFSALNGLNLRKLIKKRPETVMLFNKIFNLC